MFLYKQLFNKMNNNTYINYLPLKTSTPKVGNYNEIAPQDSKHYSNSYCMEVNGIDNTSGSPSKGINKSNNNRSENIEKSFNRNQHKCKLDNSSKFAVSKDDVKSVKEYSKTVKNTKRTEISYDLHKTLLDNSDVPLIKRIQNTEGNQNKATKTLYRKSKNQEGKHCASALKVSNEAYKPPIDEPLHSSITDPLARCIQASNDAITNEGVCNNELTNQHGISDIPLVERIQGLLENTTGYAFKNHRKKATGMSVKEDFLNTDQLENQIGVSEVSLTEVDSHKVLKNKKNRKNKVYFTKGDDMGINIQENCSNSEQRANDVLFNDDLNNLHNSGSFRTEIVKNTNTSEVLDYCLPENPLNLVDKKETLVNKPSQTKPEKHKLKKKLKLSEDGERGLHSKHNTDNISFAEPSGVSKPCNEQTPKLRISDIPLIERIKDYQVNTENTTFLKINNETSDEVSIESSKKKLEFIARRGNLKLNRHLSSLNEEQEGISKQRLNIEVGECERSKKQNSELDCYDMPFIKPVTNYLTDSKGNELKCPRQKPKMHKLVLNKGICMLFNSEEKVSNSEPKTNKDLCSESVTAIRECKIKRNIVSKNSLVNEPGCNKMEIDSIKTQIKLKNKTKSDKFCTQSEPKRTAPKRGQSIDIDYIECQILEKCLNKLKMNKVCTIENASVEPAKSNHVKKGKKINVDVLKPQLLSKALQAVQQPPLNQLSDERKSLTKCDLKTLRGQSCPVNVVCTPKCSLGDNHLVDKKSKQNYKKYNIHPISNHLVEEEHKKPDFSLSKPKKMKIESLEDKISKLIMERLQKLKPK